MTWICSAVRHAAIFLLTCIVQPARASGYLYTLTEICSPDGGASRASAINNKGWVVGETETSENSVQAFVWSRESGFRRLGTLGGPNSHAIDINHHGFVVGESDTTNGIIQAFGWQEDRGMFPLPVPEQTVYSSAYAVNERGQIVGALEDDRGAHAVMWQGDQMTFLPRLPGIGNVQPLGINNDGDVVGQIQTGAEESFASHAYYFRRAPEARNLAEFQLISPQSGSAAVAINASGISVGYTMMDSARVRAFQYTRAAGMALLDDHDALYSSIADINDDGVMVGSTIPSYLADETAGVWLSNRWFDLNEITDTGGDWWLVQATGINAGREIAGYGLHGENNRAFILVPVEGQDPGVWPVVSLEASELSEDTQSERSLILNATVASSPHIRRVLFYENGMVIGTVEEKPYEWGWHGSKDFEGEFYAEVVDLSGRRFRSPRLVIETRKENSPKPGIHE